MVEWSEPFGVEKIPGIRAEPVKVTVSNESVSVQDNADPSVFKTFPEFPDWVGIIETIQSVLPGEQSGISVEPGEYGPAANTKSVLTKDKQSATNIYIYREEFFINKLQLHYTTPPRKSKYFRHDSIPIPPLNK